MKNTITSVKQVSENTAKAIAVYAYRLTLEISEFQGHEEFQVLYNALVKKLGLEKHASKVLDAFIARLIKQKKLTRIEHTGKRNPFDMKGLLKVHFEEDSDVYDNCGNFMTNNEINVNLCRCLFAANDCQSNFPKIIASTFFYKDNKDGEFSIPGTFRPNANSIKAEKDFSEVKFLCESLKLTDDEISFLSCAYRLNAISELYDAINYLHRRDDSMDRITVYSIAWNREEKDVRRLLNSEQKIVSFGLIDKDGEFATDAMACIESQDLNIYFADIIEKDKRKKCFGLDSFSVGKDKTELVIRLLKNSCASNILLFGQPGSGKTEYAKSVVKASGLNSLIYKNELEVNDKDGDDALYRLNCLLSVKQENSVVIVDEAETILKTIGNFFGQKFSLPRKGTVNKMLENTENKVIWILNYTNELDESTLRRFTYSLRFEEMPKHMLRSIAETKLDDANVSGSLKNELLELCGKYHVTGSSVDNMVKTVKGMNCSKENEERIVQDVSAVLEANSSLIFGKAKMRELVRDSYDLSVLNTSTPAQEMVEMVEAAVEYSLEHKGCDSGIRLLFYGVSGSGKTELVRYLADKLNKKIVLKRASDLLGMYVGETERNIRNAFAEAERSGSILLFDEADSFFADRADASKSWERTMVNEFLTQMEEFPGILVCTTNLRKIMDPAMERRFHMMTEFRPLKADGIKTLLGSFFGDYEFDQCSVERLADTGTVTPGDFGSLSGRMRFIPKSKLNSNYILTELEKIQNEKNASKSIGFGCR